MNNWPAATYDERSLPSDPDNPYQAAVVPRIAELSPVLDSRTQALIEDSIIGMVRFDADLGHGSSSIAEVLLRCEAVASSAIEGISASELEVALGLLGSAGSDDASLIAANVRAAEVAFGVTGSFGPEDVLAVHSELLSDSAPDIAGRYRTQQAWIGGWSTHAATFVPQHHELVDEAMEDLLAFGRRDDLPVLAQLETIHPFADGNGRTGRALIASHWRSKDIARNVPIPISAGILVGTKHYFESLNSYRGGNVQPIVELFAQAAYMAVRNAGILIAELGEARAVNEVVAGAESASVRRASALLPANGAVTAEMVARAAGVSPATSYRIVGRLVELDILAPADKVRGVSTWVSPSTIAALKSFDRRARSRYWG